MPPWTRSSYALVIATCLWLLPACTAWQYDIENCDPALGLAACLRINVAEGIDVSQDCAMVWQCNKSTLMCERSVKDVDQDGDVLPKCGGTDCNDNDSRYSGIAQSCGCNLAGQPCKAGKGACVVDLTSECRGGSLACPEQLAPQYRDMAWHKEPFTAGSFSSWDWNCNQSGDTDENVEKNCAFDTAGVAQACVASMCPPELVTAIQNSTDYKRDNANICAAICSQQRPNTDLCRIGNSPDINTNCINRCGAPIFRCRCTSYCTDWKCSGLYCGVATNFGTPIVSYGIISCR